MIATSKRFWKYFPERFAKILEKFVEISGKFKEIYFSFIQSYEITNNGKIFRTITFFIYNAYI